MESKTSKERWIYATAGLYHVSVEDIRAILDQCKEFYGNKLDFEQQKNYVRAILDKTSPLPYFQFNGEDYMEDPRIWSSKGIPDWFIHFYDLGNCVVHGGKDSFNPLGDPVHIEGYIGFVGTMKRPCREGDYVINTVTFGIMSVPKSVFEQYYKKNEIRLYRYCRNQLW